MVVFHPGQRIRVRGEEWQVSSAREIERVGGPSVWEVVARGLSGIVRGQDYCFLSAIDEDIEILDPSDVIPEQDTTPGAQKSLAYLEAHLRRLLPRNGALYLGQHGAFTPYPYQLVPAARALHKIRPRILIGDSVGLGKTIECGILLSELIRRGRGRRILCAVPKATLEQFQNEMWGRFSIPLHRLDSTGIQRLKQDLPSTMNPFYHHDRVIISLDTLKIDSYRRNIEDCEWDVVVIDEAHNVANRTDGMGGSLRHRVARRLADRSRALILLSATPHDGTPFGFSSLIKLVDRAAVANDDTYSLEDIRPHFLRRTRSRVNAQLGARHERQNRIEEVPLRADEEAILKKIHGLDLEHGGSSRPSERGFRELFTTTLIKSFLSSPPALIETLERKVRNLRDPRIKVPGPAIRDAEKLELILNSVRNLKQPFSRLESLGGLIRKAPPKANDRIVIFTERLATLKMIRNYLLQIGIVDEEFNPKVGTQPNGGLVAMADGSLGEQELQAIVKAFQNEKSGIRVLVASNVASEGLNLHTSCHRLFHFDLPWSFITLEQRNGRIDRLGQNHVPEITYFASKASATDKSIKDDFWIVDKLKVRQSVAARDLDEEALARGFTEGASEESFNTEIYQDGLKSVEAEPDPILALLAGSSSRDDADLTGSSELYRKELATLFPGAPKAFVLSAAALLGVETEVRDSTLALRLTSELRREARLWPREFRPREEESTLLLESSSEKMATYYQSCVRNGEEIRRSFLNEIHPAIALMEDASLHLFPGKHVPAVASSKTPCGDVILLCQATLFNEVNEPVFQGWEAVSFSKGSAKARTLFGGNLQDHERLHKVADWVRNQCSSVSKKKISVDSDRLDALADSAIITMQSLMSEARKMRAEEMGKALRDEVRRVQTWRRSREDYLTELKYAAAGKGIDAATRTKAEYAKREMDGLEQETKALDEYIRKILATQAQPDVQILAIFVGE